MSSAGRRRSRCAPTSRSTRSLAESTIGLYKTELIARRGSWRNIDDVEIATLEYVDLFNHRRFHGQIGMIPPAELEAAHAAGTTFLATEESNNSSLYKTRGGSTLDIYRNVPGRFSGRIAHCSSRQVRTDATPSASTSNSVRG